MHILLFLLFFVLFASRSLGFDLSLAPGLSVKNAFLYLIFGGLMVDAAITRRYKPELLSIFTPLAIYAFYATFTWLVVLLIIQNPSYSPRSSLISLKSGPIENLLILLVFYYGIKDRDSAVWLLRSIVWLIIVGNVVTVIDTLNLPNLGIIDARVDGRVGGTIGNANEFAAFLALFFPLMIALYWTEEGIKKTLFAIGTLFSGVAFIMAVSRGAIVGLVAGAILGVIFLRAYLPASTVIRAGFGAFVLCVAILIGAFMSGYGELLLERFGQFDASSARATSGRTIIWGRALSSMLDNPVSFITGYGWYAYESANFRFATHNAYLNILYNLGLFGCLLFVIAALNILRCIRLHVRATNEETRPLLIAFVFGFLALLVTIFFGELYSSWLYVWAFVGTALKLATTAATADTQLQEVSQLDTKEVYGRNSSFGTRT